MKADELWEKYSSPRLEFMSKREFLLALKEYEKKLVADGWIHPETAAGLEAAAHSLQQDVYTLLDRGANE